MSSSGFDHFVAIVPPLLTPREFAAAKAVAVTLSDVSDPILVPLGDNPSLGERPLAWSLELWGEGSPWFSSEEWLTFYARASRANFEQWDLNGVDQEQIYIALLNGEVVGAIALVDFDDVEDLRPLKPWVAAFVVNPARRGQGLGSSILTLLEERARAFKIPELFLWTEDRKDFYLKRGYSLIEHREYPQIAIDVLKKKL